MASTAPLSRAAPMENNMHPRTICLAALLLAAGASEAAVQIDCKPGKSGRCPAPPAPPAPPTPPAPPAPPAPRFDADAAHATMPPLPPAPPALPAPPAPPPLPEIPAAAHAACAGKPDGSTLSWTIGPGETMRGLCERVGGRMVFQLRSYQKAD